MDNYIISGIQQVGIGVSNVHEAFKWYRQNFGFDVPIFDEAAVAGLMLPYTDGQPQSRHAILALNMQGGGGFEIWQYTHRTPRPAAFDIQLGDTGIYAIKIKSTNVHKAFDEMKAKGLDVLSAYVEKAPNQAPHFWVRDPFGNLFQVIESNSWFQKGRGTIGGIAGVVLGTSNIEKTTALYRDILGYDEVVYDKTTIHDDFKVLPSGELPCNRVLLRHSKPRVGAFAPLLNATEIELVQIFERTPNKIFKDRLWGELGYIHLCFDINGMEALKNRCHTEGYPFTVDSANSFDMGEAAGRFAYIEDTDGTLIEFVETHKVPILKSIGWYLNLQKRPAEKPLARWMLKAMGMNRVKD